MNPGMFSSDSSEWETPQWLFDKLNARFQFTIDVCANFTNKKCTQFFSKEGNGLTKSWYGHRCWMNPPYGRGIIEWVQKAYVESCNGALIVGLLPARTDTKWWQEYVQRTADVRFIAGRLVFGNAMNSAPFPSAIAVWWGWKPNDGGFLK